MENGCISLFSCPLLLWFLLQKWHLDGTHCHQLPICRASICQQGGILQNELVWLGQIGLFWIPSHILLFENVLWLVSPSLVCHVTWNPAKDHENGKQFKDSLTPCLCCLSTFNQGAPIASMHQRIIPNFTNVDRKLNLLLNHHALNLLLNHHASGNLWIQMLSTFCHIQPVPCHKWQAILDVKISCFLLSPWSINHHCFVQDWQLFLCEFVQRQIFVRWRRSTSRCSQKEQGEHVWFPLYCSRRNSLPQWNKQQ